MTTDSPDVDVLLVDGMFHEERLAPSCGLGCLAGYLRQKGFEVRMFSPNNRRMNETQAADWVAEHPAPVIGISLLTPLVIPHVSKLLDELRVRGVRAFTVLGGHGASLAYEQLLRELPTLDAVVVGDGEEALEELLQRLRSGEDWRSTRGVARRGADGAPVFNGPRKAMPLEMYPVMAIDLLEELVGLYGPTTRMSVHSSRGCYADCTYCSVKAFTRIQGVKPYRMRSIQTIVDEIELIATRLGALNFVMEDDNFLVPGPVGIRRAKAFKEELKRRNLRIRLWLQTRPECISEEGLLHLMEAGVDDIFIGTESFDQQSLDLYHRNNTVEESIHALEVFEQLGFSCSVDAERRVRIGSMVFHPYITLQRLKPQVKYFRRFQIPPKKLLKRLHPAGDVALSRKLADDGLVGEDGEYRFLYPEVALVFHTMRAFRSEFIELREKIRMVEKKHRLHEELGPSPTWLKDARQEIDRVFLDLFEQLCDLGMREPAEVRNAAEQASKDLRERLGTTRLHEIVERQLQDLSRVNLNM